MKLQGMSQDAIANRLNELGILSPFEYKISSGSRYKTGFRQKEQALWSSVTVRRILENEVYIGNAGISVIRNCCICGLWSTYDKKSFYCGRKKICLLFMFHK